eukprot:1160457-Pelagomonas_calceolata.AAC.8
MAGAVAACSAGRAVGRSGPGTLSRTPVQHTAQRPAAVAGTKEWREGCWMGCTAWALRSRMGGLGDMMVEM